MPAPPSANQTGTTEKQERLKILRISGLPDDLKQAKDKFLEISKTMGVALTPSDFTVAITESRAGKKTIIAKFTAIWKRKEVYRARAKLNGTGVYLSEHLDKDKQDLFYKCRCLVRDSKLFRAWSFDLDIYVKQSSEAQPVKIVQDDDLTQFLLEEQSTEEDVTPSLSRESCEFQGFSDQALATATQSTTALTKTNEDKIASLEAQIQALKTKTSSNPGTSSNDS